MVRSWLDSTSNRPMDPDIDEILLEEGELDSMASTGDEPSAVSERTEPPRTPTRIGAYRVLKPLGEGGMGTIYLAVRDDDEYAAQVAIKLLQYGLSSQKILERFWMERQILANMNHPNIARLLDGGTTPAGEPYFVMDYIEGRAIHHYCDALRLTVTERIRLFREVCQAVHFAHQNLIIHRDIKPTNILVTEEGRPKLLDFGIAKPLTRNDSETTQVGHGPMTPAYASPEQIRGEPITTVSDVYALGVLLFELLTGHRPYAGQRNFSEVYRAVQEHDPPPASEIVGRTIRYRGGERRSRVFTPAIVARARSTEPAHLRRALSGDLNRIIRMAMAKDPQRRYASAEQLSEDLGRHLDGIPVIAREPTAWYRFRKFIGRNQTGAIAALLIVALGLGFAVTSIRQSRRIREERERAQQEAARANAVAGFLRDIFVTASPHQGRGRDTTVADALETAVSRIDGSFADQPDIQSIVLGVIGVTYFELGRFEKAEPLLRQALELSERSGADPLAMASDSRNLGQLLVETGRFAEAEPLLRRAHQLRFDGLGGTHPKVVETSNELARVLQTLGRLEEAKALLQGALVVEEGRNQSDIARRALLTNNLASILEEQGRVKQAETLYREAIETWSSETEPSVWLADGFNNLALLFQRQARFADAEPLLKASLELREARLGYDHPKVGEALSNISALHRDMGSYETAIKGYELTLEHIGRSFGKDHWRYYNAQSGLGQCLTEMRLFPAAEDRLRSALSGLERTLGLEHPRVVRTLERLARLYDLWGRHTERDDYQQRLDSLTASSNAPTPRTSPTSNAGSARSN